MGDYCITCCSTCDLSAERLKKLGVPYGHYHYIIDGVDYADDLFVTQSPEEFYGKIDGGALPTTSQITVEELTALIEPVLAAGKDVVHIEFSGGLSGGWEQSALVVKEALSAKYPERKLYFVDSRAALAEMVEKEFKHIDGGVQIENIGTVIGSHTGPGTVALFFFSDSVREL